MTFTIEDQGFDETLRGADLLRTSRGDVTISSWLYREANRAMTEMLQRILSVTIIIFMVGSLVEVGLKLRLEEAIKAMRDARFVMWSLVWSFALCPAFAVLLTKVIPLSEPYALGMILLGTAPCAPFLPMMAEKARGDLAYVAAFMALTAVGTVVFMPFAAPLLAKGFTADPWTIAKPLVFFVATPLIVGAATRRIAEAFAETLHPIVRRVTGVNNLTMLAIALILYWRDYFSAVGEFAIGTLILFFVGVMAAAYGLSFGLPHGQKVVIALGASTRNVGAALAPMMAVPGIDRRAITMVLLAVFIAIFTAAIGARVLARFAPKVEMARLFDD
jgi:bile acid:Na+ symporter, BASS family